MTPVVRTAVLWDIDGTLLTTARAGVAALEDGVREVLGRDVDLSRLPTSGLTDAMVARAILVELGLDADPAVEQALLDVYARELPVRLRQRRGRVMEGVVDIAESLARRPDVVMGLLTGNVVAGARAKLTSYGLDRYFDFELGGFGGDGYERVEIGRSFLDRLRAVYPDLDGSVYLVGDTPSDVLCGRALGLRTIAVASGLHPVEELDAAGPWWVVERLPPPDEFLERLGL